ncbi:N-acetylmannosamine kinase [Lichenihabitans sp. Uapishka_5]|uniref:N-acetylmannosamine kinase n=1 Tax=Lichenihabitans sp. Uapishka_5 TaxID=3037302 RepID=UPI0029E7F600|nr:N-acetylmannosamine kinase [Lichenihabitans sp. Uapishka_5]MDX7951345.1 N-acetylmannosamine kinase [Lichenihabitans sp. Uapishka_5]
MTGVSEEAVLAIDMGGTKVAVASVGGEVIRDRRQIATPRTGKGADLVQAIVREIGPVPATRRIAVATTGVVREGCLTALNPSTLPIEDDFPLAAAIKEATGVEPLVINDAQAAAWAEYRYGAGRGCRTFAFVTISTGIGAGIVTEGRLLIGQAGLAGHVGHVVAVRSGPPCGCGRRGCLETLASGTAIGRRGSEVLGRPVTAPEVFAEATGGNAEASALLDDAAGHLANAFADLTAVCDLDVIAIGGGVGLAPGFLDRVRRAMLDLPPTFRRPLTLAQAGADAGLLGAAALVSA